MKFPSLPAASTLDGTEIIPGTQGGVDKRTTAQAIANLFKGTKGADIASAATTSIGAATGVFVHITGTTTITSFGTGTAGWLRLVRFAGALTLTHNATSLILPTGANITTAANDCAIFVSEGSSNWRCIGYFRANGMPLTADTDTTLAANSDTKVPTQKAVKAYVDGIVAAQDAMVFKGVIDCSADPNYPAADRGWTYRVSVAGKIGGASGVDVEQGDILICLTDGSAAGDQATVGANWSVIQTNLDGALTTDDIGSAVQAYAANLAAFAALVLVADKLPYADGAGTLALADFTAFARVLLATADAAAARTALGAAAATDVIPSINAQTGTSYTAVITDRIVTMDNAAANTFTVPAEASVAFPVGSTLELWQAGAGQTTIVADTGVTILYPASKTLALAEQHSGASLRKVAADTWRLVGDLEAA